MKSTADDRRQGAPVQFRGAEIESELERRMRPGETRGQVAKRDLERYYALLESIGVVTPTCDLAFIYGCLEPYIETLDIARWEMIRDDVVAHAAGRDDAEFIRDVLGTRFGFVRVLDILERARIAIQSGKADDATAAIRSVLGRDSDTAAEA